MEARQDELLADIAAFEADPILAPLVAEIRDGAERSFDEIGDIRSLIAETSEIDEARHQDRTAQLVLRIEKVIDVVKPELANHDVDGTLIEAFREVPSCQLSVKDADDGTVRSDG